MLLDMRQALRCRARSKRSGSGAGRQQFGRLRSADARAGGGAPKGNKNALKHGFYTAEAIETWRMIGALMRQARKIVETV